MVAPSFPTSSQLAFHIAAHMALLKLDDTNRKPVWCVYERLAKSWPDVYGLKMSQNLRVAGSMQCNSRDIREGSQINKNAKVWSLIIRGGGGMVVTQNQFLIQICNFFCALPFNQFVEKLYIGQWWAKVFVFVLFFKCLCSCLFHEQYKQIKKKYVYIFWRIFYLPWYSFKNKRPNENNKSRGESRGLNRLVCLSLLPGGRAHIFLRSTGPKTILSGFLILGPFPKCVNCGTGISAERVLVL